MFFVVVQYLSASAIEIPVAIDVVLLMLWSCCVIIVVVVWFVVWVLVIVLVVWLLLLYSLLLKQPLFASRSFSGAQTLNEAWS